jgi:hypothetical protein
MMRVSTQAQIPTTELNSKSYFLDLDQDLQDEEESQYLGKTRARGWS